MELLYEGKTKKVYDRGDGYVVMEFKDVATAFNALKKQEVEGKGSLNLRFTVFFFRLLEKHGIGSHFVEQLSENSMLCRKLEIIPVEVVVRNIATGSILKRLPIKEGTSFNPPLVELFYKSDEYGDPLICREHVKLLGFASDEELDHMISTALKVNEVLSDFLGSCDLKLVDFKLEFGRDERGRILLGDEITPDSMRIWDARGESYDKDVFRKSKGDLMQRYLQLARRCQII